MTVFRCTIAFIVVVTACFFLHPTSIHPSKNYSTKTFSHAWTITFCLCVAALISIRLSLFPLASYSANVDPSVFMYIGKMMHKGYVPYTQLFDHKGPLLYFIQYLGYFLTPNNHAGVWIIEFVNLIITAGLLYSISSLLTKDTLVRYLSVFAVMFLCSIRPLVYEGGNYVEEYALPWISLSICIFLKYFKYGTYRFGDIILLGIGFAATCLLRLNMIGVWAFFLPVIVVRLLLKKQFSDLGICIGGFVLGIGIIAVPTIIYLLKTNSLSQMIDCYFLFNFNYSSTNWHSRFNAVLELLLLFKFGIIVAVLSLFQNYQNHLFGLHTLQVAVTLLFCSISGRTYAHYAIILLPSLVPYFIWGIEAFYTLLSKLFKNIRRDLVPRVPQYFVIGCVLLTATILIKQHEPLQERTWSASSAGTYLSEYTKPSDDVLVLGNNCNLYLESDRYTQNKFFYQLPPIDLSNELYADFLIELKNRPSDIILIPWKKNPETPRSWSRSIAVNKIIAMLDNQSENGIYEIEEYEDFFVYRKIIGKDTTQNG